RAHSAASICARMPTTSQLVRKGRGTPKKKLATPGLKSRKGRKKKSAAPQLIHRAKVVQQVNNKVMLDGKKSTAERIVYDALALIGERSDKDPIESLEASIKVLTPTLEVKSRRVGGEI